MWRSLNVTLDVLPSYTSFDTVTKLSRPRPYDRRAIDSSGEMPDPFSTTQPVLAFDLFVFKNTTSAAGVQSLEFTLSECRTTEPAAFCEAIAGKTPLIFILVCASFAFTGALTLGRFASGFNAWRTHVRRRVHATAPVEAAVSFENAEETAAVATTMTAAEEDDADNLSNLLDTPFIGIWYALFGLSDAEIDAVLAREAKLDALPLGARFLGTHNRAQVFGRRPRMVFSTWRRDLNFNPTLQKITVGRLFWVLAGLPVSAAGRAFFYGWLPRGTGAWLIGGVVLAPVAAAAAMGQALALVLGALAALFCAVLYAISNFIAYSDKGISCRYFEDVPDMALAIAVLVLKRDSDPSAIVSLAVSTLLLARHILSDWLAAARRTLAALRSDRGTTDGDAPPSLDEVAASLTRGQLASIMFGGPFAHMASSLGVLGAVASTARGLQPPPAAHPCCHMLTPILRTAAPRTPPAAITAGTSIPIAAAWPHADVDQKAAAAAKEEEEADGGEAGEAKAVWARARPIPTSKQHQSPPHISTTANETKS
jgi:hypothetical protein